MLSLASTKKVVVEEEEAGKTKTCKTALWDDITIWNTVLIDEEAL